MNASQFFKKGNYKIDKSVLTCTIPTSVCFGEGKQCKNCYARNPERLFKVVKAFRDRAFEFTKSEAFVPDCIEFLRKQKRTKVRIHEAGDFYSEEYVNKWVEIAEALPEIKFFAFTKKYRVFTKSLLSFDSLSNVNIINSETSEGFNYGNIEHIEKLITEGYILCPCADVNWHGCGKECNKCFDKENTKVCFLVHTPTTLAQAAISGGYTKKKGAFKLTPIKGE